MPTCEYYFVNQDPSAPGLLCQGQADKPTTLRSKVILAKISKYESIQLYDLIGNWDTLKFIENRKDDDLLQKW